MRPQARSTPAPATASARERGAADRLSDLLYDELRRIARAHMHRQRPDHTLQATAIVHEAYLRLAKQRCTEQLGRLEFLLLASETIRRVLVDHARARARIKRGGAGKRVTLHESVALVDAAAIEVLDLEQALRELAELDGRQAKMIELRLYGGLSDEEAAEVLGVSRSTVEKDWRHARAWLRARLADQPA
jgi:RNA polymerase sigma factor (TIGR02999 family)